MEIESNRLITPSMETDMSASSSKNLLILVLIIILILSLLGINVFILFGNVVQHFINVFSPLFSNALAGFGQASGTVIKSGTNVIADTSKTGIDILSGTVNSVGDLLIKSSGENNTLNSLNQPPVLAREPPKPAESTSPILNNPSVNKNKWCLVGEYNGTRGCIRISDSDKCMSGQVFPSQQLCMNPTLTK
jgi:hypothetical protein